MFFFNCFLFLNLNFLSATIKTESVIVKTDDIIVSSIQMVNSEKKFVIDDQDYNVLRDLPTNSLLKKVSEMKHFRVKQEIDREIIGQIFEQGKSSFYFLGRDAALFGMLAVHSPFACSSGKVAIITPNKFHEWLTVFYFRSSLDEQRFLCGMYEITTGY